MGIASKGRKSGRVNRGVSHGGTVKKKLRAEF